MIFNRDKIIEIISSGKLGVQEYRLLLFLMFSFESDTKRIINYKQKEIATMLDVHPSQISLPFKNLEEMEILIRKYNDYYFNSNLFSENNS